jgi:hypothetical protein
LSPSGTNSIPVYGNTTARSISCATRCADTTERQKKTEHVRDYAWTGKLIGLKQHLRGRRILNLFFYLDMMWLNLLHAQERVQRAGVLRVVVPGRVRVPVRLPPPVRRVRRGLRLRGEDAVPEALSAVVLQLPPRRRAPAAGGPPPPPGQSVLLLPVALARCG